jgi:DivIVA domain-containing protein
MALDRQSIERRDFPIARRGYDIDAVDAHLGSLADEYEELARPGRSASAGGLASSAADQVRMIVEAAEQSAADIEREAQLEARQLRQDAREEAERLRAGAGRQARDHITRVAEVARGLLDRVESMDRELGELLDGVRAGTQRLSADLSLLQTSVEDVRDLAAVGSVVADDPAQAEPARSDSADHLGSSATPEEAGSPPPEADPGRASSGRATSVDPDREPVREAAPRSLTSTATDGNRPGGAAAWEPDGGRSAGERDGARMVALNMALNGVPREDTQHHIEQNFELDDIDSLLDEVYMRAGGR